MDSALLDDKQELRLVLQVADVADELRMIRHIVNKQRDVVKDFMWALSQLNSEKDTGQKAMKVSINNNHSKGDSKMTNIINNAQLTQMSAATTTSQVIHYLAKRIAGKSSNMLVALDGELELFLADLDAIKNDADSAHQEVSTQRTSTSSDRIRSKLISPSYLISSI